MSQWSWRAFACLAVGLIAVYFAVPWVGVQDVLYPLVGAGAVAAVIRGVAVNRPRAKAPWYLLAAGQACFVIGDVIFDLFADVFHIAPFPSVADVLYLAGYPLLAAGLALLVRDRDPYGDRASLIDALIISAGLAVVTWVFWIDRFTGDRSLSTLAILISIAYPVMDLVLIGYLARLTLAPGARPLSYRLLSASLFLLLGADVMYIGLQFAGAYNGRNVIDLGWLLSYVAIGAAALHPSMRAFSKPAPQSNPWPIGWRVAILGAACLLVPGVSAIQALRGDPVEVAAVIIGSAAIFLLVLVRLAGLLRQVQLDADRLRQQEARLAGALEREHEVVRELQRLNRLKGDFVTMVSHELRSPLTAIIGYAKTLQLPPVSQDPMLRAESLQILERQGERLLRLVENLFTASQLENRAIPFSVAPVSMEDVFQELTESHGATRSRIRVAAPAEGLVVHTDRNLLSRVVTNLVDNALKFSASGSPCELGARKVDDGVQFWVIDHGIGIEPEEITRIFDRFYQVDVSRNLSNTGVGLGLSLVKDILRDLGGSIEVRSEPHRGSTFLVTLPDRFSASSEQAPDGASLLTAS